MPQLLPAQSETTNYWSIDWYAYAKDGSRALVLSTYHNYSDGWYLELPDNWHGKVSVRREDTVAGERVIVFSRCRNLGGKRYMFEDFLKIYALSGSDRETRSRMEGRFVLLHTDTAIYAAEILKTDGLNLTVDEKTLYSGFSIIYSEWITGEI